MVIMFMLAVATQAQTSYKKVDIGFQLSQYQRDFGVGVHIISPYFLNSTMAIRAGANVQWFENFNGSETTWTTYQNVQLGVRSRNTIIEDKIFIYGEGGLLLILPNSDFSSESANLGGYGAFGFEFRPVSNFAYFIELGGVGSGATADKIAGKPIYSNGFLTNVGFRVGI